ncbi:hypothetical protein [Algoriphagus boritolerans]|uniref:hypothetical protein n=1 Tax=Algoriphagus boritolerans TaxID=308111 RepID=UPI000A764BC7
MKNIYINWGNVQTIQNEVLYNYMNESMPFEMERIEFEYAPEKVQVQELSGSQETMQRASLNWRLTAKEKKNQSSPALSPSKTKKSFGSDKRNFPAELRL